MRQILLIVISLAALGLSCGMRASERSGAVAEERGLSCSMACGILVPQPTIEASCPPHWKASSSPLATREDLTFPDQVQAGTPRSSGQPGRGCPKQALRCFARRNSQSLHGSPRVCTITPVFSNKETKAQRGWITAAGHAAGKGWS